MALTFLRCFGSRAPYSVEKVDGAAATKCSRNRTDNV